MNDDDGDDDDDNNNDDDDCGNQLKPGRSLLHNIMENNQAKERKKKKKGGGGGEGNKVKKHIHDFRKNTQGKYDRIEIFNTKAKTDQYFYHAKRNTFNCRRRKQPSNRLM